MDAGTTLGELVNVASAAVSEAFVHSPAVELGDLVVSPAVATKAFVALDAATSEGDDVALPEAAIRFRSANDATVATDGVEVTAAPAVRTFVALDVPASVGSVFVPEPLNGGASGFPGLPNRILEREPKIPATRRARAASRRWGVFGSDVEVGQITLIASAAVREVHVLSPDVRSTPDPDEELVLLLMEAM